MYRRPRFLAELHAIREEMARQCDYDVDLFAEMVRSGNLPSHGPVRVVRGRRVVTPPRPDNGSIQSNQAKPNTIQPNKIEPKPASTEDLE
jgi:hypothetical protein